MSVLLRSSEITKKPVVTYGGEDVAQIKDVVYGANGGHVEGFTLAGRGLFAGPLKTAIAWSSVIGLGPDAAIIADESSLVPTDAMLESAVASGAAPGGGDVLGSQVLTDDGTALGTVVDVIIEVSKSEQADVVGYEIDPAESLGRGKNRLLIPLPDTLAASGEHLIVPAAARDFVMDDLAGFGAAVEDFRARIKGQ